MEKLYSRMYIRIAIIGLHRWSHLNALAPFTSSNSGNNRQSRVWRRSSGPVVPRISTWVSGLNFQRWPEILKRTVCDVVCMQIPSFSPIPFEKGTDVKGGKGRGTGGGEETPLPSGATLELRQSRITDARTHVRTHACTRAKESRTRTARDEIYRSCILMARRERSILVLSKYSTSPSSATPRTARDVMVYTYFHMHASANM